MFDSPLKLKLEQCASRKCIKMVKQLHLQAELRLLKKTRPKKNDWASCLMVFLFFVCRWRCTLDSLSRTSTLLARRIPPAPCVRDSPGCLNQSLRSPPASPFDLLTLFTPHLHQRPQWEARHAFITPAEPGPVDHLQGRVTDPPCFQSWAQ